MLPPTPSASPIEAASWLASSALPAVRLALAARSCMELAVSSIAPARNTARLPRLRLPSLMSREAMPITRADSRMLRRVPLRWRILASRAREVSAISSPP